MSKTDNYRANAAECQRMADLSRSPAEKKIWLDMANSWMRMIPQPEQSASDKFDDANRKRGTGQTDSEERATRA